MIPFIHIPDAHLGPLTVHPFGVLVAIAVLVGTSLASWRARKLGVDASDLGGFVGCVLALGFIGGHVIDAVLYRPADVLARPLHLLAIWDGQGSFGGFIGAALGALGWKYLERSRSRSGIPWVRLRATPRPILPLADALLSVFPIAWIFGRMGCAVAHDHPGARTSADAIFAVAYGPADAAHVWHGPLGVELRNGSAPRYDLGLLEGMLAVVIGLAVMVSWRRRWPVGTYVAAVPLAYAPVRFALDFLRVADADGGDARYASLTPAQWSCVALAAFSTWMLARVVTSRSSGLHPAKEQDEITSSGGGDIRGGDGRRDGDGLRGQHEDAVDDGQRLREGVRHERARAERGAVRAARRVRRARAE